jgi:hypothetical protein
MLCCCDQPPPIPCEELPTSVLVQWQGEAAISHNKCGVQCTGFYYEGVLAAPTSVSSISNLFVIPPFCAYGGSNEAYSSSTITVKECIDDNVLLSCNVVLQASIGSPKTNTFEAPGFWSVVVSVAWSGNPDAFPCGDAGNSCGCPIFIAESIVFIGPPISQSPIGTYTPTPGASWTNSVVFADPPCFGITVVADVPGVVIVS